MSYYVLMSSLMYETHPNINNVLSLVMAWRRTHDLPLSEPMTTKFMAYDVTRHIICWMRYLGLFLPLSWWRHQTETFSALLAICAGNSPVPGEFSAQRPVTRSFDAFFDLYLNKWLSKQSWGWWFETPSYPLWRHRNEVAYAWYLPTRIDPSHEHPCRWYITLVDYWTA